MFIKYFYEIYFKNVIWNAVCSLYQFECNYKTKQNIMNLIELLLLLFLLYYYSVQKPHAGEILCRANVAMHTNLCHFFFSSTSCRQEAFF